MRKLLKLIFTLVLMMIFIKHIFNIFLKIFYDIRISQKKILFLYI